MHLDDKNTYSISYVPDPKTSYIVSPHGGEIIYDLPHNREKLIEKVFQTEKVTKYTL
jgi:hypothetical protein